MTETYDELYLKARDKNTFLTGLVVAINLVIAGASGYFITDRYMDATHEKALIQHHCDECLLLLFKVEKPPSSEKELR
jgi:hypothetical protein